MTVDAETVVPNRTTRLLKVLSWNARRPTLVRRPIHMCSIPTGLSRTDSSGNTDKALTKGPETRVLRLIDHDGDGSFDTSTLPKTCRFRRACWFTGVLFMSVPRHIWKLRTPPVITLPMNEACVRRWLNRRLWHDMHGPYRGPDGFFYWRRCVCGQKHELSNGRILKSNAVLSSCQTGWKST